MTHGRGGFFDHFAWIEPWICVILPSAIWQYFCVGPLNSENQSKTWQGKDQMKKSQMTLKEAFLEITPSAILAENVKRKDFGFCTSESGSHCSHVERADELKWMIDKHYSFWTSACWIIWCVTSFCHEDEFLSSNSLTARVGFPIICCTGSTYLLWIDCGLNPKLAFDIIPYLVSGMIREYTVRLTTNHTN